MSTPEEQYEQFVRNAGGTKVIKRIVVANNGMAATKFIMSIRNWLFENFGDERLIHIVAMATPEVHASLFSCRHVLAVLTPVSAPTPRLSGHKGPCCCHRRRRHLLRGAGRTQLQQLRQRERHHLGGQALRG